MVEEESENQLGTLDVSDIIYLFSRDNDIYSMPQIQRSKVSIDESE